MLAALRQAGEAKKARRVAENQAVSAKRQADAAAEQVKIMRAERDDRQAPALSVVAAVDSNQEVGFFSAKITLRLDSGPALSSVAVTTHGTYINGRPFTDPLRRMGPDAEPEPDPLTFTTIRPGRSLTFYVPCDDGYVDSQATVDLECVEEGGDQRTWRRGVTATIKRPPEAQVTTARLRR